MGNPITEGTRAAQELRKKLNFGPTAPVDVARVAERLGVLVVRRPLADGLSGIHLVHATGRSFVAINSSEIATRQNFTLAHELGHAHFDRDEVIAEKIDVTDVTPIEKRANAFAAELILPEAAIAEWRATPHLQVNVNEVARLAAEYRMSYQATLYRLKSCGVIDDVEPLYEARDEIVPEIRQLLRRHVERAFELPQEFLRMADEALARAIISKKRHAEITQPVDDEIDF